jgi:hypothetical protein
MDVEGDEDQDEEEDEMLHSGAALTSKGDINATFRIPGLVTIPSDGAVHNFTIVELELEASMTWVSIPKYDTKTHLKVKQHFLCHEKIIHDSTLGKD